MRCNAQWLKIRKEINELINDSVGTERQAVHSCLDIQIGLSICTFNLEENYSS